MSKFVFFILVMFSVYASSQQIPLVNHSFLNNFSFNPATAGLTGKTRAFLIRNERFKTFGNGLVNNYLTVDGFHENWNSGLGLELYQQNFGIQKQLGFSGAYAYRIKLSKTKNHALRFGVKIGATDFSINNNDIFLFQPQDPFLSELSQQKLTLNGSAGLNYTLQNFNLGFSIPQILGNRVNYADSASRGYYQMERHYVTNINYIFNPLFGDQITLQPNAIVRYAPNIPLQYEAGLTVSWNDFAWMRGAYKSDYASEFSAGLKLFNSIIVGYSYELPIAAGKDHIPNNGHEFLLGFEFANAESTHIKDDLTDLPKRDTLLFDQSSETVNVSTITVSNKEEKIKELLAKNLRQKQINDSLQLALNSAQKDTVIQQFNANNNYITVLQEQQSAIDSLIVALRRTNVKVAQITSDNFSLTHRVAKQDKVIDSLVNSKETIIYKESDYSSFEKEIAKLSRSNAKKQRQIDSLINMENRPSNVSNNDFSKLEREIAQLNKNNRKLQHEIDSLQKIDNTTVIQSTDLSALEEEIAQLSKSNLKQQREIDSLLKIENTTVIQRTDLSALKQEIAQLSKSNLKQQREIDSLLNQISLLEQNLAILSSKKSKKKRSNNENYANIAQQLQLKKQIDSLLFVSKSKQNQLDDLMVDNLKQTLEIDSLELLLRQTDADSYKKTDSILNLKRQILTLKQSGSNDIASKPVEIRNLKNKIVEENTDGFLSEEETNRIIKNNQGKVQNSTLKDYFIELTGVDSPKGSYIVVGAYQDIKRAKNVLKDAQKDYPESRIIFNKRNSLNYIVVMYSVNLSKTVAEVSSTQRLGYDRAWVLNYDKK